MSAHPEIITADRITPDTVHQHAVVKRFEDGMTVEYVGPRQYVLGTDTPNQLTPQAQEKLVQVALQLATLWHDMEVVEHWDWCSTFWGVTVRFNRRKPAP